MFGVSYEIKNTFFDRPAVMRRCRAANRRNLGRAGAFVRTKARDLLRRKGKKGKSAAAGEPPRRHTGQLRDGVLFGYDLGSDSVVVGPVRFNIDGGRVPGLLERGGKIARKYKISQLPNGDVWKRRLRGRRLREGERVVTITERYHPHPYMAPSLAIEAPKFPNLWAGTVTPAA